MLERPVVGIVDTGSAYNNCHRTVPELIEAVKRGVLAAGGCRCRSPRCRSASRSLHPTSDDVPQSDGASTPRRC
jgi:dihydroxy-acid dehydratase